MSRILPACVVLLALSACQFKFDRALNSGEIRGTIVVATATGELIPADGTRIEIVNSALRVQSDAAGRFVLRRLPAGNYELRLLRITTASGQVSSGLRLKVDLNGAMDLGRITLTALGRVDGTVTQGGEPVAKARVVLQSGSHVLTDAAGHFAFENVLPGDYTAYVQPPNAALMQAATAVRARETTTLALTIEDLTLVPNGSLSGRVIAAGAQDNTSIQARLVNEASSTDAPPTSADGFFSIASLDAGIYELALSRDFYQTSVIEIVIAGDTSLSDVLLIPFGCTSADPTCPDVSTSDSDNDTVPDAIDNCPDIANTNQSDSNQDGIGDACRCGGVAPLTCADFPTCGQHSDNCGGTLDCSCDTDGGIDAGPTDGGTDAGTIPTGFTDDFTDSSHFDSQGALPDSQGNLTAPAPRTFEGTGDGSEGQFDTVLSGDSVLAPGVHQYTSFYLGQTGGTTFKLNVAGDVTLLVTGAFTIESRAQLNVTGKLTIIAGGLMSLNCGYAYATDNIVVHLPSTDGLYVGCNTSPYSGELSTLRNSSAPTGSMDVWTRGPINVGNNGYITTGAGAPSGNVTIRAAGDITLGPANAYIFSGNGAVQAGYVKVYTEGKLTLDDNSYIFNGNSGAFPRVTDQGVELHARGDLLLRTDSYIMVENGSPLLVETEGDILLDSGSYMLTGRADSNTPTLTVKAHTLTLQGSWVDAANSTGKGGSVDISLTGNLVLAQDSGATGSGIYGGSGSCSDGGDVRIQIMGDLTMSADSEISAGGTSSGCTTPPTVGTTTVNAGGTITLDPAALVTDGAGTAVTVTNTAVVLQPLDAGLEAILELTSKPLSLPRPLRLVSIAFLSVTPTAYPEARILIATSPLAPFVPLESLGASAVEDGWRYRVHLQPRLFDPASVHGVTVSYAVP